MNINQRIDSFVRLGKILSSDNYPAGLQKAIGQTVYHNPWFTEESTRMAVKAAGVMLDERKILHWLKAYRDRLEIFSEPRTVAVIMAGNIPMVGFHDLICVLISGNRLLGKLSNDDRFLLPAVADLLCEFDPAWNPLVSFSDGKISNFQTVIATGSNNSSRYFEYYFGKYPHIIRGNRNGIAILTGRERNEELEALAGDVFYYYGLGCRNVSKIYFPEGFQPESLNKPFSRFSYSAEHPKYRNNYEYHKAIYMVNGTPFHDGGFFLMTEQNELASPVSEIHYEYYSDRDLLIRNLDPVKDQIQCIVSHKPLSVASVLPGKSQLPELWDYADNIDTLEFLLEKI